MRCHCNPPPQNNFLKSIINLIVTASSLGIIHFLHLLFLINYNFYNYLMLNQFPMIVLNKIRKNPANSTNEKIEAPTASPIQPPTLAAIKINYN